MKCAIIIVLARVAKLADALDLGSSGQPYGFESLHAHHDLQNGICRFYVVVCAFELV